MTLRMVHRPVTCLSVDRKQLCYLRHDLCGGKVLLIELRRFDIPSPRVSPTCSMHHIRSADTIVGRVSVRLQNAFKVPEKTYRAFAPATHAKLEDD